MATKKMVCSLQKRGLMLLDTSDDYYNIHMSARCFHLHQVMQGASDSDFHPSDWKSATDFAITYLQIHIVAKYVDFLDHFVLRKE